MSISRPGSAAPFWRLVPVAVTAAVALGACAPAPTPTPGMPAPAVLTDGNIGSVAQTYNTGIVQMSQLATMRSTNPAVRRFAEQMVRDHNADNQMMARILSSQNIQPAPSSLSQDIQNMDNQTMASLQSLSGAAFDRAYLDSEISQHQWAIDQLDRVLIPQARDKELRDHLKSARTVEARHLKEAEQLRSSLGMN